MLCNLAKLLSPAIETVDEIRKLHSDTSNHNSAIVEFPM